jgi:hypothetical protein
MNGQSAITELYPKEGGDGDQIEAEKVSPSLKMMERICRALELTISDFLRLEPHK